MEIEMQFLSWMAAGRVLVSTIGTSSGFRSRLLFLGTAPAGRTRLQYPPRTSHLEVAIDALHVAQDPLPVRPPCP